MTFYYFYITFSYFAYVFLKPSIHLSVNKFYTLLLSIKRVWDTYKKRYAIQKNVFSFALMDKKKSKLSNGPLYNLACVAQI